MKSFVRVMKALSDPNRVRVLKVLAVQELCVCEIQALLGLAQSTTSKHMKILEDAGLVQSHKEGGWLIYQLAQQAEPVAGTMLAQLPGWLNDDPTVAEMLARLPQVRRDRSCVA